VVGRDPLEDLRVSSPLELLFDLCFVVAVGQAGEGLREAIAGGAFARGLANFLLVFFAIWWPWVNYTWFASAYATDDVVHRFLTFVQIAGVLVVAAGVPRIFASFDFSVAVAGYVIMRGALVLEWLRAAHDDRAGRAVALRYGLGVAVVQLLWVVRLGVPGTPGLILLVGVAILEHGVPILAERSGPETPWHPGHIAERYGLFTIIVLGECVLAATTAIQTALGAATPTAALIELAIGGLILVFGLWWAYFKDTETISRDQPFAVQIAWGYGHYVIFVSIAAIGAGLQLAADSTVDPARVPAIDAGLLVGAGTAIFLTGVSVLHRRWHGRDPALVGIAALVLLALGWAAQWMGAPLAIVAIGLVVAAMLAGTVIRSGDPVHDEPS